MYVLSRKYISEACLSASRLIVSSAEIISHRANATLNTRSWHLDKEGSRLRITTCSAGQKPNNLVASSFLSFGGRKFSGSISAFHIAFSSGLPPLKVGKVYAK